LKFEGLDPDRAAPAIRGMLSGKQEGGMSLIRGFDVVYTHRGSWTAHVRKRGRILAEVPIAWASDYVAKTDHGKPELGVWFKAASEAGERLRAGAAFAVALTRPTPDGAGSSDNISNLFEIVPLRPGNDPKMIICRVERSWTPEIA
jgi:hypothetical protein